MENRITTIFMVTVLMLIATPFLIEYSVYRAIKKYQVIEEYQKDGKFKMFFDNVCENRGGLKNINYQEKKSDLTPIVHVQCWKDSDDDYYASFN